MNSKSTRYALGAALFLVFSVVFVKPVDSNTAYSLSPQLTPPKALAYSEVTGTLTAVLRPTRVTIPSIKVNADIIDVGITKTNNLDVPPNYTQVGWYKYGTLPGNSGNAVIDGHVDNGGSIAGPFKKLRYAKVGDEVTIAMSDGTKVKYVITDSVVVPLNKFPKEYVFAGGSDSVLKIITCHGKFVPKLGTYDQRLIVTAIKKGSVVAYK